MLRTMLRRSGLFAVFLMLLGQQLPTAQLRAQEEAKPKADPKRAEAERARRAENPKVDSASDRKSLEKSSGSLERDRDKVNPREEVKTEDDRRRTEEEKAKERGKAQILEETRIKGREWEQKTEDYLADREGNVNRQVTLESRDGVRSRADLIYEDRENPGKYVLVEAKASDKANYTENQRQVFDSIKSGDKVTGERRRHGTSQSGTSD